MNLTIISDTHGRHNRVKLSPCDVLIHCGDFSGWSDERSLIDFLIWFESKQATQKIFIGGNHDGYLESNPGLAQMMIKEYAPTATYLQDSGCEFGGYKFYGSPYTPTFMDWYFMRNRGEDIARHWSHIPQDTDVLITHGPPYGFLDETEDKEKVGCRDLKDVLYRVRPKLHCFGHIHHSHGQTDYVYGEGKTILVNGAICREDYRPLNSPITVTL